MTSLLPWLAEAATKAATAGRPRSEAQLSLPDFRQIHMLGMSGWSVLALGLVVSAVGLLFGLAK
ncbi:MAG TPA: hypothetical protein VGM56_17745, partial [Byssovorax sp.]